MEYDNGDDVETIKREALAESRRWARVDALHAIPRSVLIATPMQQAHDETTSMELAAQGLSKLCPQSWADGCRVRGVKSVCCMLWPRPTQPKRWGSEGTC